MSLIQCLASHLLQKWPQIPGREQGHRGNGRSPVFSDLEPGKAAANIQRATKMCLGSAGIQTHSQHLFWTQRSQGILFLYLKLRVSLWAALVPRHFRSGREFTCLWFKITIFPVKSFFLTMNHQCSGIIQWFILFLFFWWYMCVVCKCVTYMCRCTCAGWRGILCFFLYHSLPCCLETGSSTEFKPTISVDWLAKELPRSSCLYIPDTGLPSTWGCA